MTNISVEIVKDSINVVGGTRITSFVATFPRSILSEMNTHREFSGNTSSSRAIPIQKIIDMVENDPFIPHVWTKNQRGMQGYELLDEVDAYGAIGLWKLARDNAVRVANALDNLGVHKQVVNRLLEPFMWCRKLITTTSTANFLALRDHHAAEPHIQIVARKLRAAMESSMPQWLSPGEWHVPFDIGLGGHKHFLADRLKVSTARAAHTSYTIIDGAPIDLERGVKIYNDLVSGEPLHASPFEHCAVALASPDKALSRNFNNWGQLRAFVEQGIELFMLEDAAFLKEIIG